MSKGHLPLTSTPTPGWHSPPSTAHLGALWELKVFSNCHSQGHILVCRMPPPTRVTSYLGERRSGAPACRVRAGPGPQGFREEQKGQSNQELKGNLEQGLFQGSPAAGRGA